MSGQDCAIRTGPPGKHGPQEPVVNEAGQEAYWSRFARSYDRDGEYVVGTAILQAIVQRLAAERDLGDCLEFGCGTGYFTRALAANARRLVATDLSDEMLEVARTQLGGFPNVTVQKADCTRTEFEAGSYDSVLLANLLHVIRDPSSCLRESYRLLRMGGRLIVVDFTSHGMTLFKTAQLGLRYLRRWGAPPRQGQHNLSPEELVRLVESVGFRVKNVELVAAESNALYLRGEQCAKPRST